MNCAEKGVLIGMPDPTSANNCWKFMFANGVVKIPETGMLRPVLLSTSVPTILKEAEEVDWDVFCKLNGDWSGTFGVHVCPAAAGKAEQPATPSIPARSSVNVKVIFGAAENVIKSVTGTKAGPGGVVTSGGLSIFLIDPASVMFANAVKPPVCNGVVSKSPFTNEIATRDMLA